jgi:small-conductance mechanosensitive channel
MMEFLELELLGLTIRRWLGGLALAVAVFVVLRLLQAIVRGRFVALARHTKTEWDDILVGALGRTRSLFLVVAAVYTASAYLFPAGRAQSVVRVVFVFGLLWQVGVWASTGVSLWLDSFRRQRAGTDASAVTTVTAIGFIAKLVLWSVVVLLALDNLGVEITTLVAGLGVGGIAVALAVQNILGDLLASLSIVLDKPFVIGDFVVVGDYLGSVEHVGLKTTRVRSLSGEQLVFSNNDLLKSRIRNYGRMYERRVVFGLGVTYGTPREKLKRIPEIIRSLIEGQENARFDRSHFKEYGDSALLFESVYYVKVPDYTAYMDIQQVINLGIHEAFEREGIEFAFPTRTVYVERPDRSPESEPDQGSPSTTISGTGP